MIKKKILTIAKWVWVIAVVVFIGIFFIQHLPEEIEYLKTIQLPNLFLAILLLLLGKLAVVELARQSVKRANWTPTYLQMLSIVAISQLGKYVPGGIWHIAARINSYKENSLSNKKTAKVMVLENIWLVSGGIVFAFFMLALDPPAAQIYSITKINLASTFWLVLRISLPLLWIIGLFILEKLFPMEHGSNVIKRILLLIIIQAVIWLTMGSSFYLVFQETGFENYWLILGGYTLSWAAGYLVIFAPGGIGVREFVLVVLFSGLIPTDQIAIYSIVDRLIYTVVEVGLGGIGYLLQRIPPAKIKAETD